MIRPSIFCLILKVFWYIFTAVQWLKIFSLNLKTLLILTPPSQYLSSKFDTFNFFSLLGNDKDKIHINISYSLGINYKQQILQPLAVGVKVCPIHNNIHITISYSLGIDYKQHILQPLAVVVKVCPIYRIPEFNHGIDRK